MWSSTIAKKQRIRAEETIKERLGYSDEEAKCTIKSLFVKLGITFMEIMYMPALNKDNIRGLVTFDRPDVLWEALNEGHGVVMLACHMDNWQEGTCGKCIPRTGQDERTWQRQRASGHPDGRLQCRPDPPVL